MTNAVMDLPVRIDPAPAPGRSAAGASDASDSGAAFAKAVDQAVSESRPDRGPVDRRPQDHDRPHGQDSTRAPDGHPEAGSDTATPGRTDGAKGATHSGGKGDQHDKGKKNDGPANAGVAAFWAALPPSHAAAVTQAAAGATTTADTAKSGAAPGHGLPAVAVAVGTDRASRPALAAAAASGTGGSAAAAGGSPKAAAALAPSATAPSATAATATATAASTTTDPQAGGPLAAAAGSPSPGTGGTGPGITGAAAGSAAGAATAAAAGAAATAHAAPTADPNAKTASGKPPALQAPPTTAAGRASAGPEPTKTATDAHPTLPADHKAGGAATTTDGAHPTGGANGSSAAGSSYAGQTAGAQAAPASMPAPTPVASTVNSTPVPTQAPTPTPFAQAQPNVAAILAQLRGAADGSYQLRAQVHPAELGAVAISATVHHGALTVTLTPDQAAQQAISQSLPQLRQHLADQGFTGVNVGLGFAGQPGSGGHGDREGRAQGSDHSALQGMDTTIGAVNPTAPARRTASASSALDRML